MSKPIKAFLIISASIVALLILFFLFSLLFGKKPTTNIHEITEDFSDISIFTDTANTVILPSEDNSAKAVIYEKENNKHSVTVSNGSLEIKNNDTRRWYERINIDIYGTPKITLYLPKAEYGALKIRESTGDIETSSEFKFASIDISASTGDIRNLSASMGDIKIITSTGDITNIASANGDIEINASTGNVKLESACAKSLNISVSTGKVTVSNAVLEDDLKIRVSTGDTDIRNTKCSSFISSGSTGDVRLTDLIATEKFDIERSTGDVKFDSCDAMEIFAKTDTGNVTGTLLTSKKFFVDSDTGHIDVPSFSEGGRCEISTDTGNIIITVKH